MTRILLAAFTAGLLLTASTRAQAPIRTATPKEDRWTVDDLVNCERAGDLQISPDCRWVVWTKSVADKEKGEFLSNLVRSSLTEKEEIDLTRGMESCTNPKWSPDGRYLAFVTSRIHPKRKSVEPASGSKPSEDEGKAKPQLWLMNPFGGEPWPLTELVRGVARYEWADADTIVFTAQEAPSLHETATKEEKKDSSEVVEDEVHAPPVRFFKVSVKGKKITRLTDNQDRIESFALSPDGRYAVANHDRSLRFVYDNRLKPMVVLHDFQSGAHSQILNDRKLNILEVSWEPNGKGFYVLSAFTHHPRYLMASITELYHYDVATKAITQVDLGWENGLATGIAVTNDGFLALLADGVRNQAARYIRQGKAWKREWLSGDHVSNLFQLKLGKDNKTLLYEYATASIPTQWYRARLEGSRVGDPAQVVAIHRPYARKTIARTEVVHWRGARNEDVEGILYYPHPYQPGRTYPLVVMIHGGPAGANFDNWEESPGNPHNILCQRGAFVLKVNYHGSSHYGLDWAESISGGKYYDLEVPDIERGVDALISRGLVDADKLGVMGWSNGSILTIALTVHSTRYKAASAGAGDVEWSSDWGNCEFGAAFDNYYLGKSPLEDPQLYLRKSPFYHLDRVRTPTIIFFGTEDKAVPTQQGWMHYRALQQLGKTEVRFVLFPGEGHALQKLVHQRRKLEEELAWFDRHLFKTAKEGNEALKAGSPLAQALQRRAVKATKGRYGLLEKGTLIPETVRYGDLVIGRFEVTRAQFAQFDNAYPIEPGKENYPANGISFAQAKAYCDWLSRLTGRTYRLPREKEEASMYDKPAPAENTLDFWAGYPVNPDDAARLRPKIQELGSPAPLLKEVGIFQGAGNRDLVFDLGGNVAEWAIAKDGKGRPAGGSADTPADAHAGRRQPAAEYIGFRVVTDLPHGGSINSSPGAGN
jgi:dipeptidyl aminopeptidase/acylaminoacyl peptidase